MSKIIDSLEEFKKIIKKEDDDLITKFMEYLKKDLGDFELLVNIKMGDLEETNTEYIDDMISKFQNGEIEDNINDYSVRYCYVEYVVLIRQTLPKLQLTNITFKINKFNYFNSFLKCTPVIEIYDSVHIFLMHNSYNRIYSVLYDDEIRE